MGSLLQALTRPLKTLSRTERSSCGTAPSQGSLRGQGAGGRGTAEKGGVGGSPRDAQDREEKFPSRLDLGLQGSRQLKRGRLPSTTDPRGSLWHSVHPGPRTLRLEANRSLDAQKAWRPQSAGFGHRENDLLKLTPGSRGAVSTPEKKVKGEMTRIHGANAGRPKSRAWKQQGNTKPVPTGD